MQYLDKLGWPVVTVKGRPIFNFLRLLIHTKKIKRGRFSIKEKLDSIAAVKSQDTQSDFNWFDYVRDKHHG